MDVATVPPCLFLLASYIAVLAYNRGADFSVPKFMLIAVVIMIIFTAASLIYIFTRKTDVSQQTANKKIDYTLTTDQYKDKLIEISTDAITFKNYYFPVCSKSIKLSEIEYIKEKPATMSNGLWRLHGTSNFRTWFPADYNRLGRDKIFIMKVKNKWMKIGFTTENSYAVSEIFKSKGLLR